MPLFKRKEQAQTCPICSGVFTASEGPAHWSGHVYEIPEGQGDATGQFTWECACGPSGMKWPNDFSAITAMAIHMYRQHSIAVTSPLDNTIFMSHMERQLGLK